jgi:hypothetical protein
MRLRLARQRGSYPSGSTWEQQEFLAISAAALRAGAAKQRVGRKGRGEDPFYRDRRSFCNGPALVVQFVRFINAHSHICTRWILKASTAFSVSTEGITADFTKTSTFQRS